MAAGLCALACWVCALGPLRPPLQSASAGLGPSAAAPTVRLPRAQGPLAAPRALGVPLPAGAPGPCSGGAWPGAVASREAGHLPCAPPSARPGLLRAGVGRGTANCFSCLMGRPRRRGEEDPAEEPVPERGGRARAGRRHGYAVARRPHQGGPRTFEEAPYRPARTMVRWQRAAHVRGGTPAASPKPGVSGCPLRAEGW
jgi:hypothetical protein